MDQFGELLLKQNARLTWIANSLLEVETLDKNGQKQECVEITWYSDSLDDQQATRRFGASVEEAFFKALDAAMAEYKAQNE
jgi:hypothetical protein